jgi:hypothetical protein
VVREPEAGLFAEDTARAVRDGGATLVLLAGLTRRAGNTSGSEVSSMCSLDSCSIVSHVISIHIGNTHYVQRENGGDVDPSVVCMLKLESQTVVPSVLSYPTH